MRIHDDPEPQPWFGTKGAFLLYLEGKVQLKHLYKNH
jgi:hypothetical protein